MAVFSITVATCALPLIIPVSLVLFMLVRWLTQVVTQMMWYNLPPGPRGVPILGCLPQVDKSTPLHYILTEMAQTYGEIFSMRLGDKLTFVISSKDLMKKTLALQGRKFAGRPRFSTFKETKGGFDKGLSLRDFSEDYKENRKVIYHGFKNLFHAQGKLNTILPDECDKFVTYLKSLGSAPFDPQVVFRKAAASTFLRLTFGDNLDYEDEVLNNFIKVMEEWFEIAESNNPADFITLLECLPNDRLKKARRITESFDDFCKQKLLQKWQGKSESDGLFCSSFVQELTSVSEKLEALGRKHEEDEIVDCLASRYASVVTDMIGGGFDTVPNTLSWMLLYLDNNTEAQNALKADLRSNDRIDFTDILNTEKNPYLAASVYETIRHSTVAPLALPHSILEDVKVGGYDFPKDSLVMVNLWAINHSPELWSDPFSYDPSRFLINNNDFDLKAARSVTSFSTGVRRCPGEKLAITEMQAFVGTFLKHFDFQVCTAPKDMRAQKGLTSKPQSYEISVTSKF